MFFREYTTNQSRAIKTNLLKKKIILSIFVPVGEQWRVRMWKRKTDRENSKKGTDKVSGRERKHWGNQACFVPLAIRMECHFFGELLSDVCWSLPLCYCLFSSLSPCLSFFLSLSVSFNISLVVSFSLTLTVMDFCLPCSAWFSSLFSVSHIFCQCQEWLLLCSLGLFYFFSV